MSRSSEETKLSKAIRETLTLMGIWWIRLQSGKISLRHGGFMRLCENGCPDVWTPYGFLEVKDLAQLSADQRAWHSKAKSHNVNVAVVRSPKEALDTVLKWKREKETIMCCNNETNIELKNAATRFRASHIALLKSDVYRETLEAADAYLALTDDTKVKDCDAPVTEKDTDSDDDGAQDNAPAKYDDATVDSIVRRALTGIDSPESALNVMRLSKECELDSKAITKSLKRIGALNNGGVKRGVKYYLPVVATETEEAEVE